MVKVMAKEKLNLESERLEALASYLKCEAGDVEPSRYSDESFDAEGAEYLVLTDDEATEKAREYCLDSLWAFSANFLVDYIEHEDRNALIESIQMIQEKQCESASPVIRAMLGSRVDEMIQDAIDTDGRGHFLAGYDFEEGESGKYYIYRTN